MKKINVKLPALKLNKDTLRTLSSKDLSQVAGGGMTGADDQANNCPGGNGGRRPVAKM